MGKEFNVLEKGLNFAVNAHCGQKRKTGSPYILHPMEVATIIATLTSDIDVQTAGLLHDTVEDTDVTMEEILQTFGKKIADLVVTETEIRSDEQSLTCSWKTRKQESLDVLKNTNDDNVRILWLGDKLSNMRSFYREYLAMGDDFINMLNQKNKKEQYWYYSHVAMYTEKLKDTLAYKEYVELLEIVFGSTKI